MNGGTSFRLVLIVALNCLVDSPANAGVVKRSLRMVREVYPPDVDQENDANQPPVCIVGDVVYGADETVPAEQPCLKCRCQPPGVQCETVQCTKKPGCKALHRPNKCCPDYQCECEHNGNIYANGEKLESNPGGECKVCYCRGGEVQCTEVSCYIRNDCIGKRVPGTCCPKYDHCPPIDFDRSSSTETTGNTVKPVIVEEGKDSNVTAAAPHLHVLPEDINKVPDNSGLASAFEEVPLKEESLQQKITIQEIIPERKEIPITAPPKIFISEPQGTLLIEEALPTSEYGSNDLGIDSEPESSEVSEVFQHPPPVLRIGDKLLFLKRGNLVPEKDVTTPDSVITIIGAEGLQRGGVEESLEVHELKIEPEALVPEGNIAGNPPVGATNSEAAKPQENETQQLNGNPGEERLFSQNSTDFPKVLTDLNATADANDLELKVSESTHILSLVKRKDKTTTASSAQATTTQSEEFTTLTSSIEESQNIQTTSSPILNENPEDAKLDSDVSSTSSNSLEIATEASARNTEPLVEQNPAYPPIPDIMPAAGEIHQKAELEVESSTKLTKIFLPDVNEFLSNKTKNETHSEWLKAGPIQAEVESLKFFTAATLPDELLNQKSPIDEDQETTVDVNRDTTVASIVETHLNDSVLSNFEIVKEIVIPDHETPSAEMPTLQAALTSAENSKTETLVKEGPQLIAEVKILDTTPSIEPPKITDIASVVSESISNGSNSIRIVGERKDNSFPIETKDSEDAIECLRNDSFVETLDGVLRSVESMEIDSGELTTPKTNHSSMVSAETASVENDQEDRNFTKSPLESIDLVQNPSREGATELGSLELFDSTSESILKDVVMFNNISKLLPAESSSEINIMKHDVELIEVANTPKPTKLSKVETSTYELLPTPEETQSKTILKREVNSEDDVFKDLEKELNDESANSSKSPEEDQSEADQIFKELLQETEQDKVETKTKSIEQEKGDKLSKLVADVALKGKFPDINALRQLGLFGNQSK